MYRLLTLFLVLLTACGSEGYKDQQDRPTATDSPADTLPPAHYIEETSRHIDSVIHLAFAPDSTSLTVEGQLTEIAPVTCYLPADRKVRLTAQLLPGTKDLNIRFSQIIFPDGKADGPFGQELKYTLAQKGTYRLIISSNLMANGKRNGSFVLKVKADPVR